MKALKAWLLLVPAVSTRPFGIATTFETAKISPQSIRIAWDVCDTRAVLSASLATILFCSTDFKVFFVHCTNLSHAPPKWGALRGWKFHSISFGAQMLCTFSSFSCLRLHLKNSTALHWPLRTKLVLLSLYIFGGFCAVPWTSSKP